MKITKISTKFILVSHEKKKFNPKNPPANTNFIVFGVFGPGLEPMIYHK
jgi:hypothetical protein